MSPSPAAEQLAGDLNGRLIRLEEWRSAHERESAAAREAAHDREMRLRALEASYGALSARLAVIASVGSAIGTALLQLALRAWGHG